jgi:16S rRNA (guanine966-N2)-methyltransferase
MPRIIAGRGKGRRLATPRGSATRPTAARVKQTLFDILARRLPGCRFLDLCAGGGTVGLEAASRGAALVVLVELDRHAAALIRRNAEALAAPCDVDVRAVDCRVALRALAREEARFDLVYLDPPYESPLYEPVLEDLATLDLLAPGALVVAEHFHKRPLPETIGTLVRDRSRRIGDHILAFYRAAGAGRSGPADVADVQEVAGS